ncbi:MAG: protein TonB [Sulfurimonas sp.]|jgi:protein TonB
MNRYFHSFIISALSYLVIIIAVFYALTTNTELKTDAKLQDVKKISISVINQPACPKPKIEKKITPKPKTKPKTKPKAKPVPRPKPRPIHKPTHKPKAIEKPIPLPIKKTIIEKKKVEEKAVVEEEIKELKEKANVIEETLAEKQREISHDILLAKQNKFISDLVKKINENKSYPNIARRRGIEGLVNVKFYVYSNGNVKDIKIVSGKSIFKNSAREAISKSFPISISEELFNFPKKFNIKISYILK